MDDAIGGASFHRTDRASTLVSMLTSATTQTETMASPAIKVFATVALRETSSRTRTRSFINRTSPLHQ